MTWVVADHAAAPGSRELSVTKGQQVEVLENGSGHTGGGEWTLVRLPSAPGQSEPPPEGLVPTSALKQPPTTSCKTSPSRKAPSSQQTTVGIAQQSVATTEDTGEYHLWTTTWQSKLLSIAVIRLLHFIIIRLVQTGVGQNFEQTDISKFKIINVKYYEVIRIFYLPSFFCNPNNKII